MSRLNSATSFFSQAFSSTNRYQFFEVSNWLSNHIFKSYDDIVNHCCFAWNRLVDQPWRIISIGLRQWAHGY